MLKMYMKRGIKNCGGWVVKYFFQPSNFSKDIYHISTWLPIHRYHLKPYLRQVLYPSLPTPVPLISAPQALALLHFIWITLTCLFDAVMQEHLTPSDSGVKTILGCLSTPFFTCSYIFYTLNHPNGPATLLINAAPPQGPEPPTVKDYKNVNSCESYYWLFPSLNKDLTLKWIVNVNHWVAWFTSFSSNCYPAICEVLILPHSAEGDISEPGSHCDSTAVWYASKMNPQE